MVRLPLLLFVSNRILQAKRYGMFNRLKKIFRRDSSHQKDGVGERLLIEGTHTQLTPEPDDAEVAAQALLESLCAERGSKRFARFKALRAFKGFKRGVATGSQQTRQAQDGTAEYYRELAERVKEAHEMEARLTVRRLAYCEQELRNPLLNAEQLAELERGLYRHMDAVDREGGELKRRWQHVLAEVVVRSPTLALPSREGKAPPQPSPVGRE